MIIDTHQHFYEPGTPSGKGPMEYKILALPEGVTGTILLAAQEFALNLANNEPLIVGVVGKIPANEPDFGAKIEKLAANPLFRGIRNRGDDLEDIGKGSYISNMEKLAGKDLVLDVFRICEGGFGGPQSSSGYFGSPRALAALEKLAKHVPKLRIIVSHIAHCPIDGNPLSNIWEENFRRMADHPNIYMKVSGLMERATWRAHSGGFPNERAPEMLGYYRPTLDALWEIFGEDRLIYGSNWPVCEQAGDFLANGLRIVRAYFAEKGEQASSKFFWKNSQKIFKWKPRLPSQR